MIFTGGTRAEYLAYIRLVLSALSKASLHLDLAKYEFGAKMVKYLGFIIIVGKGISCNPDKL